MGIWDGIWGDRGEIWGRDMGWGDGDRDMGWDMEKGYGV